MGNMTRSIHARNVEAIAEYCTSGIKSECKDIGIELEHTLIHENGDPVSYSGKHGAEWVLSKLADSFPKKSIDDEGNLLGLASDMGTVTLEPASQIELSAGPFENLDMAAQSYLLFEEALRNVVEPEGIKVLGIGYHPTRKAADLNIIPKARYDLMNDYLGSISEFGICMMRGSAATQVAIDYCSLDDCFRKLRLASACVPVFSLICDNSPTFEAQPRKHRLVRTEIWNKCDPARCGIIPGVMEPDFTLEKYAEYLLGVPAIFEITPTGRNATDKSFDELFADKVMNERDVEHALSLLFNDVRLKTYIEIRPADAMPARYVISYAALIKGLFYSNASLDILDEAFEGVTNEAIAEAKSALMEKGYDADIYGRPVAHIADKLIKAAESALDDIEKPYLQELGELVDSRKTLADIAEAAS